MKTPALLAGAVALGFAIAPMMADAAPLTLTLGASNLGSSFPPPFGTVTVTLLDSTDAQLTFESNVAGGYIFIDGGAAAANFNGTATLSLVSCNAPSTSCGADGGSGNEDGFGKFSNSWNLANAGTGNRATEIVLDAKLASGTWNSEADVLAANAANYLVAAHIGAGDCTDLTSCNSVSLNLTGFAGNGSILPPPPPQNAPEPLSLAVLGTGLVGLGIMRRQRR